MQEDQDERHNHGKVAKWFESTAVGRKLLGVRYWLYDLRVQHDYRFSSLDEQAYRFCFRLASFVILTTLVCGTAWLGWTAYRYFSEKHDQALAELFLARHDYRAAVLCAQETLSFNPANLSACRILEQLSDLSSSPSALDWQQRIVAAQPNVTNKLQLASLGLRYQKPPFPLTTQILQELSPAATNLAGYQLLAGRLALSTGHVTNAETHFEMAVALAPTNQFYVLNLAALRVAMSDPGKKLQAREALEKLRSDPNLGPAALRALVVERLESQDVAGANLYSTELIASPQATLGDQFQNLKILQTMKSPRFAARLGEVQDLAATNAPKIGELSAWMQANNLLAENIQWLNDLPDDLKNQRPVQLALAQAYLQSNDWSSLRSLVIHGNWGDQEFLRFALVSHASAKLGMMDLATLNWESAVTEGGSRLETCTKLLDLAQSWDLKDEQVELLEHIVEQFPKERWAQQRLAHQYFATGNMVRMYELSVRMNASFPNDVEFLNNVAAAALLLRTNLPQAYKWAAQAYAGAPANPNEASTFAYALHLQHHDKEGLAVLQKLPDTQLKQPSVALYYGLLLVATGNSAEAKPYLQIAQASGGLWPEEQKLFDSAWQKANDPVH